MHIARVADLANYSSDHAQKSNLAEGAHCRVTLWCLEPGQEIHPHAHAGDHVWVVQEGEGWFLTDTGTHPVGPGSVVFAPAGEPHGMRARERLAFVSVSAG
ncbi:MAG: cupin domain-containing protein [Deferrisomatales bacterium]